MIGFSSDLRTFRKSPSILVKASKPKPSVAFDTYWRFATERQNIFFSRLNGRSQPWSDDEILNKYKFTNVYRAADRVSQYLIRDVISHGSQQPDELFFRILLFKIFNRIGTWEFLQSELGEITLKDYSFGRYDQLLSEVMNQQSPIYSAAYIMASGRSFFGNAKKHQNHLRLIELMIRESVPAKLQECRDMGQAYKLLLSYPSIGEFLSYQFVTDMNYSSLIDFTEMEFVKAGPGAKDGIRKCFTDLGDYSFEGIIEMVADQQEREFERLGLPFRNLFGRRMQLIDCQNVFCEVDKYSRVAHPELQGYSHRIRIKQKYKRKESTSIDYYFPEKWGLHKSSIEHG